jgi:hypothetical protein
MVVVLVNEPELPVMVTVTGPPRVAVLDAVRVSTLVLAVVGLGLKLAVTPLGSHGGRERDPGSESVGRGHRDGLAGVGRALRNGQRARGG